jgi:catalase-peroxidase
MGFPTFGFAGGRADVWEPDNTYWGNETEWLANKRYDANREADTLEDPLAAVQMGLIYVNPEGPDGNPDFKLAAADIRTTFARMAMNDEETVALIAGGHAFGKTHGAGSAEQVGPEPEAVDDLSAVGLGWKNSQGKGHSEDTISSGLEVTWTPNPIKWDNDYLKMIYEYDKWELEESPAGAKQWRPVADEIHVAPHAHLENEVVEIRMLTTDLALRFGDEEYDRICRKFLEDFDYFTDVFARAWFKLTHRDMGPVTRYHGPEVPAEVLVWQDPVERGSKSYIVNSGSYDSLNMIIDRMVNSKEYSLTWEDLIEASWASAFSYRNTDKRGGANGARIRLEPQRSWKINEGVMPTINVLEKVYREKVRETEMSFADFIVYAGTYAVGKKAPHLSQYICNSHFTPGRGDATQAHTDVESFNHLKPIADGFRNVVTHPVHAGYAEKLVIEKAALLGLTPPQFVLLLGGLRSLLGSDNLSTAYFENILDIDVKWSPDPENANLYVGVNQITGVKLNASRVDMLIASHSVLRAYAEVYASYSEKEFSSEFIKVWKQVMENDMFDIKIK